MLAPGEDRSDSDSRAWSCVETVQGRTLPQFPILSSLRAWSGAQEILAWDGQQGVRFMPSHRWVGPRAEGSAHLQGRGLDLPQHKSLTQPQQLGRSEVPQELAGVSEQ